MQSPSLNACANCETKILPTSKSSCQTPLIKNRKSQRNFSFVTTMSIFDSALELEKRKDWRLSRIFAPNTECWRCQCASLTSCKKVHLNRANCLRSHVGNQRVASAKVRSTS